MIYKVVHKYVFLRVSVCLDKIYGRIYIDVDKYLNHHEPHSIPVSGGNATNSLLPTAIKPTEEEESAINSVCFLTVAVNWANNLAAIQQRAPLVILKRSQKQHGGSAKTVMVVVDGKPVRLQLCDTAGQDELESLRPLCYRNADVFLLCYSVVRPCSFRNLTNKWAPEIQQLCPGVPLILVGTQLDLREDVQVLIHLAQNQQRPVSTEEGRRLALELGAVGFTECSALTQKNLKDTFDGAILASFQQMDSNVVQQQRMTLRKKTPDKIKSLSEAWWKKLNCLIGEGSCELK
ncbi:rho-related GTP-binding protein RhoU-like isoform X2 [Poecilia reticulata]|uniref:rho-related GTP-binding protein RhoU-like isoform X2 n=1 Tax=Poecilia reticulata TaxID=8081 RepID=UPI0007EBEC6D|nr:PREDICTED: rho-related GTP-binding protein RhoU-like isoform X2 [Poecilia reticulata]